MARNRFQETDDTLYGAVTAKSMFSLGVGYYWFMGYHS